MTNRLSQTPGRKIRHAGPIVGVLATVGIALGAWVGVASAASGDAPRSSPATVAEVGAASDKPAPSTDGDKDQPTVDASKNKPAVDGTKDKPKGVVEAGPKVVNPGKPWKEQAGAPAPSVDKASRQLDPANPKVNGQGPQARAEGGRSGPTNEQTPAPVPPIRKSPS
ncbi:hypothetical protein [Streptomyces sp. SID3343]|uniref:hypothetical protein n=1 Tax=Streptomyces sp. SID3343 TaxID=2690260 RepID=UPI00136BDB0F|nr:hypothetical protein [Streptomyces sp. SID3343]MYW06083.1 hypothetical protein [Streptomyces sp. SID3343]